MAGDVTEFARGVAAALGGGWRAVPSHERAAHVRHTDGRGLFLYALQYPWSARGRVRVSGVYPEGFRPRQDEEGVEIAVALVRDPEAIARDIARRLLPRYEALLAVAVERCAEQDRLGARRDAIAAAVMEAAPGSRMDESQSVPVVRLGKPFGFGSYMRTGYDPGKVSLHLADVPAGAAADVVRMLAGLGESGAGDGDEPAAASVRRRLWQRPRWLRLVGTAA